MGRGINLETYGYGIPDSHAVRVRVSDEVPEEVRRFVDENCASVAKAVEARAKSSNAFKDKTGKLRRSIKALKSAYEFGGWIVKASGNIAPHAHLIELGHAIVTKDGRVIGQAPAHPFLRPALEAEIDSLKTRLGVR